MKKTKGFSYDTKKDKDVIEHIEKQPIQNKYVWDLVREDMNQTENKLESMVKNYVDMILKSKNIKFEGKKENDISKDDVANLLNIFNN